jgi:predicted aldo/keto reductase-like oxidoreductase
MSVKNKGGNDMENTIKKLGFGLMRLPVMPNGEIDMALTQKMVDLYMENGFSYFDTAYVYMGGKSEVAARELLVNRYPRDSFQLATKLPVWTIENKADVEHIFNNQLEKAGVDYFDIYLLHGLSSVVSDRFPSSNTEKAEQFGAWEFLSKIKAQGKVKHIGFSFHDSEEVLDHLLTEHPEIEFVQSQINYADWEDTVIRSRACYETARKHDKPVIVMESVKGGTLANLRQEVSAIFKQANPNASTASWAIRYAASLDGVLTVLSGMSNLEQMKDNVSFMKEFKPLDKKELNVIESAVKELHLVEIIGCTGCKYCIEDCPQNINIPKVMEIMNDYRIYKDQPYAKRRYSNGLAGLGKASNCIGCGSCENRCPQKLKIPLLLKEAVAILE